jgi:hypothetical protein
MPMQEVPANPSIKFKNQGIQGLFIKEVIDFVPFQVVEKNASVERDVVPHAKGRL